MNVQELDFPDITPTEVAIKVGGVLKYKLREANEEVAVKFRNAAAKCAILQDGKVVGVGNVADVEPYLVSMCLYNLDQAGNIPLTKDGHPDLRYLVPLQTIRSWPPQRVSELFAKAKEISHLNEGEDTKEALEQQLEAVQARLAKLNTNGKTETEELVGNSPNAMMGITT